VDANTGKESAMETDRKVTARSAGRATPRADERDAIPLACLVWIDAREAIFVRWLDDRASVERLESEVPSHHRSTGHVRHDPLIRHGGGGRGQTAGEPDRLEHLKQFLDQVAARVHDEERVIILGPGTVREHLQNRLEADDEQMNRTREISCEPAARLTERQLVARLRAVLGASPRRGTVGAYRWTTPPERRASGAPVGRPRRVVEKASVPPADAREEAR
jgi:hypothetical protein